MAAAFGVSAVDKHRADQRFAHIREDRGTHPPAGIRFRSSESKRRAEIDRTRDVRAGFPAHEIG